MQVQSDELLKSGLKKLQEVGWSAFSFQDLAHDQGISLGQIRAFFPTKQSLLQAHFLEIDQHVLAIPLDSSLPLKDRIFEIIMTRFDTLTPYKKLISDLCKTIWQNPCLSFHLIQWQGHSILWMTEALYSGRSQILKSLFHKLLWSIYFSTWYKWLQDSDPDLSYTMAFLDQILDKTMEIFQELNKN